ncbi:MAG TPA: hypothetical protein VGM76_14730 [Lacipirellulaceae bacterium]|jgi:hypothetical protein
MQLGKSLVGAVIGSVLGVGLVVAIYYFFVLDHAGLAILVAACAGLGVRAMVTTRGHASYLRGALTCILAIAAFAGSKFLIADLAARGLLADVRPIKRLVARPVDNPGGATGDGDTTAQPTETPQIERRPGNGDMVTGKSRSPQRFSTWDFIWLSVAALVAYELGRGTDATRATDQARESAAGTPPPR